MYLLAICYLLSYACYLKLATSCKYLIPFAPVVRLALVFKLRQGASITANVGLSVCRSVCRSVEKNSYARKSNKLRQGASITAKTHSDFLA